MYDTEEINIIEVINNIDSITMESVIDVYTALSEQYDKITSFIDHSDIIYQEGEVWDKASGKYTNDNILKKIVLFLPRLITGIINQIFNTFGKNYEGDVRRVTLDAQTRLEKCSDDELDEISQNVSEVSKSEAKLDKKTKKISLFGGLKEIWNRRKLLVSCTTIVYRIKTEITKPDTDYKKFAKDLKDVLQKNKDFNEETISLGVDAFSQGLFDINSGSLALAESLKIVSNALTKRCEEEIKNGNASKSQDIKDLIDQIQQVSALVSKTTFFGSLGLRVLSKIGNPLGKTKWGRTRITTGVEKKASDALEHITYADDYNEIDDLERSIKSEERSSRSKRRQDKKEEKLHKKKRALRKRLDEVETANKSATDKLEKGRLKRSMENDIYDDSRKIDEND